jgi:nucleoside-diphosphate-sugar epimerase
MMQLAGHRVLVTGASGFVGKHLCRELRKLEAITIGVSRRFNDPEEYLDEQIQIDIADMEKLRNAVNNAKPDYVVHLAAAKNRTIDFADYNKCVEVNIIGTSNLAEVCCKLPQILKFCYVGTADEYGPQLAPFDESSRATPVTAYGLTKLAGTQLMQALQWRGEFPCVVLRPTVLYGPEQDSSMFLPSLIRSLLSNSNFEMTTGVQTRDYLYIDDMVRAIVLSLTTPTPRSCLINIGSAKPVRIIDLALSVARIVDIEAEKYLNIGARDIRQGEAVDYWVKNTAARKLLLWRPQVSLDDGLRRTVDYYRNHFVEVRAGAQLE